MSDQDQSQQPNESQQQDNNRPSEKQSSPPSDLTLEKAAKRIAELEAQVKSEQRSYSGLQGNYKSEKARADELAATLDQLNRQHEALKVQFDTETGSVKQTAETVSAELERAKQEKAQLERALQVNDLMLDQEKFPNLAALTPRLRATIRAQVIGLEGEELENELTAFNEEYAGIRANSRRQFNDGKTPSKPAGATGAASLSFEETSREMARVMREKGVHSDEYKALREHQNTLIQQGLHRKT